MSAFLLHQLLERGVFQSLLGNPSSKEVWNRQSLLPEVRILGASNSWQMFCPAENKCRALLWVSASGAPSLLFIRYDPEESWNSHG
jgi:hypothetical protein